MKRATAAACLLLAAAGTLAAQDRPWQRITVPTCREAARLFASPPPEYGVTIWWWWNGPMTEDEIARDLRDIQAHGIHSVLLWAYYGLSIEYLSREWFERVRFAVEQARRVNMRVWLMDEGSYPSGFAGGRISREHPELRMQALAAGPLVSVAPGARVSLSVPEDAIAAIATDRDGRPRVLDARPGTTLEWSAPADGATVVIVRHEFRTNPTRLVNNPGFPKDTTYSFIDPLNPRATRQFLAYVHEEYKKYLEGEFGRTVMGFMGDEPSVAGVPWTPGMPAEFQKRKGYDVRPHLAGLLSPESDRDARRVRADYWDVWTDLYSDRFFAPQTAWCAREGLDYIVHLCGEEDMKVLLGLNGDYFKCNRTVQVPGVDAIWRQIWPGKVEDYPKLASSAAHLRGRPRAFTESYGVYGAGITLEQARWVLDYQFVRGINQFQVMGFSSSNAEFRKTFSPPNWNAVPQWEFMAALAGYGSRLSYLLSVGRPAASIALYYPTTSGWLGDFVAEKSALSAARQLLERQRDFDFIDEDGLRPPVSLDGGALRNASGQAYRAVIVPAVSVISKQAWETLGTLARGGGQVIFLGKTPAMLAGATYLDAAPAAGPLPPHALVEASGGITEAVLARLPVPDLELSERLPAVKYLHRRLADGEVYFLFNESDAAVAAEVRLAGAGTPEIWDAASGARRRAAFRRSGGAVQVPLRLGPFATSLIVLSNEPAPAGGAANVYPEYAPVLSLDGEWSVAIAGRTLQSTLQPWADLGAAAFSGAATYRREFRLPGAVPRGATLDLGRVLYAARVRLNGHELGAKAWRPFRWDIGAALRPGLNVLEVDAINTGANALAADPQHYREIEARGWLQNSYVRMYLKFDQEMIPSGLLGPVRILEARDAR